MARFFAPFFMLAVLALPVQILAAEGVKDYIGQTRAALVNCNALLGSAMAKINRAMDKLPPDKQKVLAQRVDTLESEIGSLEKWVRSQHGWRRPGGIYNPKAR